MEKSCGTIPYTIKGKNVCYLLIKAKGGGYCGFPKGHIEYGESEREAAMRETLEETSLHVKIHPDFRYEINYDIGNGINKTVVYYLARFQDECPERYKDFENFDYLLLPFSKAYQILTFDNTKQMLKSANDYLTSSTLYALKNE